MTNENTPPTDDAPPYDGQEDEPQETTALSRPDQVGLSNIARSETLAQIDAAHQYPRDIGKFVKQSISMATRTRAIAESCMYSLERKDKGGKVKYIVGPSIRLAEIIASTYGNIHAGARPVDVDDRTVTCQGVAWDTQTNTRITAEVKRRITGKNGRRYGDDMIILTQNACSSIALRNAILRVVPRSLVDEIFEKVLVVARGERQTMEQRQAHIVERLGVLGVKLDRILAKVSRSRIEDITIEDIDALIGFGTRVREDGVDEVFPPLAPVPGVEKQGQRIDLGAKPGATAPPASTPMSKTSATPRSLKFEDKETKQDVINEDKGDEPGWNEKTKGTDGGEVIK